MECKRCGTRNPDGALKCEFCGGVLEEIITITMPIWKKCPVCGYTLAEDEQFCRYCGQVKEDEDQYEETQGMSNGMKIFLKIMILFFILVLLFIASFFGVQMVF